MRAAPLVKIDRRPPGAPLSSIRPVLDNGLWLVLIGAVMISFSAVFARAVSIAPTSAAFYRMVFGGTLLFGLARAREEFNQITIRRMMGPALCGAIFCCDMWVWHKCIAYVGPGLATILGNFQVFLMALCGVFIFGDKVSRRLVFSIPLAILGLFMLVGVDWGSLGADYKFGVMLGLLTAFFYTGYLLTLRRTQSGSFPLPPITNLALVTFFTAFFLGVFVIAEGESFVVSSGRDLVLLLMYGTICQALGWLTISRGLTRINVSKAGLLLLLQPGLSLLWDIIFFSRPTTAVEMVGAVVTLAAIYMGSTSRKR